MSKQAIYGGIYGIFISLLISPYLRFPDWRWFLVTAVAVLLLQFKPEKKEINFI